MKKYQVFVSSTYTDLRAERQAAVEAILKAGHIPAGMELFAAGDESQLETIKRWIDSCDIYMLILGSRYGSIEPKSGLSYTEIEYDYAVSKGKALFAVVVAAPAVEQKVKQFGPEVIEQNNASLLEAFRKKVLGRTSSFFTDTKDVKLAVFESISDLDKRYSLSGWILASEIPDTKPLVNEISRLTEILKQLEADKKALEHKLSKSNSQNTDDIDFLEIATALAKDTVKSEGIAGLEDLKGKAVPALNLFYAVRDSFAVGIENKIGMSAVENYEFFQLAPKLQIHGLVVFNKVSGAKYRRCELTDKGRRFLAYLVKRDFLKTDPDKASSKKSAPEKPKPTAGG